MEPILNTTRAAQEHKGQIRTFTGRYVNPLDMKIEDIDIRDIAHHLSNECRFAGAVPAFYCVAPSVRVLTHDFQWVPAGDVKTGDLLWGCDEHPPGGTRKLRKWRVSKATVYGAIKRNLLEVEVGGTSIVCSEEHPFLVSTKRGGNQKWMSALDIQRRLELGQQVYLSRCLVPWETLDSRAAGWVAGMFDGEGSLDSTASRGTSVCVTQNEGHLLTEIKRLLKSFGFSYRPNTSVKKCQQIAIAGGLNESLRLLGSVRPSRLIEKMQSRLPGKEFKRQGGLLPVTRVRTAGVGNVVALETSTHTYITEGFASHNSVAQHSVAVARRMALAGMDLEAQLAGLLHDAAEAYLKDVPSPVKHAPGMEAYCKADDDLTAVIFEWAGLRRSLIQVTKSFDDEQFQEECLQFWGGPSFFRAGTMQCWSPEEAKTKFLMAYDAVLDRMAYV